MSPIEAWKEKFQLSASCTLEEALRKQLINEIEYQEWASKYYGLPILEDEYFTKNPSDANFLDTVKKQNIANPSAIPCFEWNSILYVACLEPQKINTHQETVFLIVSLKTMESLWKNIQPSVEESPQQKQATSEELQPLPQVEKTLNTTKKPILEKIDNDGIEFEYMHQSKSIMFFIKDFMKAFINFIAPEHRPSSKTKTTDYKSKSITISNSQKNNKTKNLNKIPAQPITPSPKLTALETKNEDQNTSSSSSEKEETPTPIALTEEDLSPNKTPPVAQKPPSTSLEKEETPTPIALTEEDLSPNKTPPAAQKPPSTSLEKEETPTPIALTEEDLSPNKTPPVAQKPPSTSLEKEETPTPIALTEEDLSPNKTPPAAQKPSSTSLEKEETPTPIALTEEDLSPNKTPPATQQPPPASLEQSESPTPIASGTKNDKQTDTPPPAISTPSLKHEKNNIESESQDSTENISSSFLILDKKKVTSLDQLSPLRRALEETKHYINSYILFVFKKDSFIPYKWSSNLQAQKTIPGTIQKPSVFRIIHVSKQPYFGHLAPVLANNSFFNQWGFETLPKHVLLIPFLDTDKQNILGAYLGISETRTLPIKCLHAVEQIIQPLSTYYEDGSLLKKVS